jgi:hypothetical protein
MDTNVLLFAAFGVLAIIYLLKRRSRVGKSDD